jgi:D-alanine-D-alanine ligase
MRVAIVHNALSAVSTPDEADVLSQVAAVSAALTALGHRPYILACDLNLAVVREELLLHPPDLVFNLVEVLAGTGRLIHLFPGLLDSLGVRYSGASAESLLLTSNKILAKERLRAANLPTPEWVGPWEANHPRAIAAQRDRYAGRWIIKSVWEHASIGLDSDAILDNPDGEMLFTVLARRAPMLGGSAFAESFIAGREFNLSIIDGPRGPEVLPPAEIVFEDFGAHQARIVDYKAKWDDASYEYQHTPRRFDFGPEDADLLARLSALALSCWRTFHLNGYARVDFRVDEKGAPWILEINANPCISPDAGFSAALARAGISYAAAVGRIIAAA